MVFDGGAMQSKCVVNVTDLSVVRDAAERFAFPKELRAQRYDVGIQGFIAADRVRGGVLFQQVQTEFFLVDETLYLLLKAMRIVFYVG
ncbi:hypothetical protein SDC9_201061 [bioreactor metagenome]|uniref:Uncharacterized protein n=1 Tax=bioreactor metagenome TaxID=1076179 RepID=A0A645IQ89_9ZZZZ